MQKLGTKLMEVGNLLWSDGRSRKKKDNMYIFRASGLT